MKHPIRVATAFLTLFLLSHAVGLTLLQQTTTTTTNTTTNTTLVETQETGVGERPDFEGWQSIAYLGVGILITTAIILWLSKHQKFSVWRTWFAVASTVAIYIALSVILAYPFSLVLAVTLGYLRYAYNNPWLQNATEIFMYAGIALFLAPLFDVTTMLILLLLISIYDAWAVWKSKHMVQLAEFTKQSQAFPGFSLSYTQQPKKKPEPEPPEPVEDTGTSPKKTRQTGALGGGDVIFPLLFSSAVYLGFLGAGYTANAAFLRASITSITAATALFLLFYYSKKGAYYPAMPFITAGSILGYICVLLL